MNHNDCIHKLIDIGKHFGFHATGRSFGKMFHLGNPDCVWYYKGRGAKELRKIAKGDKYKYLPFIAFEVTNSENQKDLRGTLVSLQLTNASASIVVLMGKSMKYRTFMKKLIGRYSSTRLRIWTEKDVNELYKKSIRV